MTTIDLPVVQIVNHVVLSGTMCLFGIVVNVINMIIFYKLGLQDTVNISLFAISVSDLLSLVTLEWVNINLNPFMDTADIPYEPVDVQYLTGGWPHACFARITIWITVGVTAERFCCVAFPVTVKQIFSPLRTKVAVCVIYVVMFALLLPLYSAMYFGDKFILARNETRVGFLYRDKRQFLELIEFQLYAVIEIVTFFILTVLTSLLVASLKHRSAWRQASSNDVQGGNALTTRDRRKMKLVSLVAIMVIVCFTPAITMYFTTFFVPGFSLTGAHSTIFNTVWSITFLIEAINSSFNIFLFYTMNSKYRKAFRRLFSDCKRC